MNTSEWSRQVKETLSVFKAQLEENSVYNNLKDRYDALSLGNRKLVIFFSTLIFILLLASIPLSNINSSQTSIDDYESNLEVINDLLRYKSIPKSQSALPVGESAEGLVNKIKSSVDELGLLPEQIVDISIQEKIPKIVKGAIIQNNVEVSLKSLNLTQVVNIGYKLQELKKNVKLLGMEVKESSDKKDYFNVSYQLASFHIKSIKPEKKKSSQRRRDKK